MNDLISRQAAIDALAELARDRFTVQDLYQVYLDALKDADMRIRQMPSAQPEPKTGRWLDTYNDGDWHCSECGAIVEKDEQIRHYWQRCYHCGARMKGADDE